MRNKEKAIEELKKVVANLGLLYGEDSYTNSIQHYLNLLGDPKSRITAQEYRIITYLLESVVFKILKIDRLKTRTQMTEEASKLITGLY